MVGKTKLSSENGAPTSGDYRARAKFVLDDIDKKLASAQSQENARKIYDEIYARVPSAVKMYLPPPDAVGAHLARGGTLKTMKTVPTAHEGVRTWAGSGNGGNRPLPAAPREKDEHLFMTAEGTHGGTRADETHAVATGRDTSVLTRGNRSHAVSMGRVGSAFTQGANAHAFAPNAYGKAETVGPGSVALGNFARSVGKEAHAITSASSGRAVAAGDAGRAVSLRRNADAFAGNSGVAANLAPGGKARAGENGSLIFTHQDENGRHRHVVGYVGENGIEPSKWYHLNDKHEIELHPNQED